jgi:hypothetical protein
MGEMGKMDEVTFSIREVLATEVNMPKLVALCFKVSITQASRLIRQKSVTIIERNVQTKEVEAERISGMREYLFCHARETETILKCGRNYRHCAFVQDGNGGVRCWPARSI